MALGRKGGQEQKQTPVTPKEALKFIKEACERFQYFQRIEKNKDAQEVINTLIASMDPLVLGKGLRKRDKSSSKTGFSIVVGVLDTAALKSLMLAAPHGEIVAAISKDPSVLIQFCFRHAAAADLLGAMHQKSNLSAALAVCLSHAIHSSSQLKRIIAVCPDALLIDALAVNRSGVALFYEIAASSSYEVNLALARRFNLMQRRRMLETVERHDHRKRDFVFENLDQNDLSDSQKFNLGKFYLECDSLFWFKKEPSNFMDRIEKHWLDTKNKITLLEAIDLASPVISHLERLPALTPTKLKHLDRLRTIQGLAYFDLAQFLVEHPKEREAEEDLDDYYAYAAESFMSTEPSHLSVYSNQTIGKILAMYADGLREQKDAASGDMRRKAIRHLEEAAQHGDDESQRFLTQQKFMSGGEPSQAGMFKDLKEEDRKTDKSNPPVMERKRK